MPPTPNSYPPDEPSQLGQMQFGSITAQITSMRCKGGKLLVEAIAGQAQAGTTAGWITLLDQDGSPVLCGAQYHQQGDKPEGTKWIFTVDFDLLKDPELPTGEDTSIKDILPEPGTDTPPVTDGNPSPAGGPGTLGADTPQP